MMKLQSILGFYHNQKVEFLTSYIGTKDPPTLFTAYIITAHSTLLLLIIAT